jgi:hypothetical protein
VAPSVVLTPKDRFRPKASILCSDLMACVRLSRMTGFIRKFRKKFPAEMGSIMACGTLSFWYKGIGVAPKSANPPVEHLLECGRSSRCPKQSKPRNKSVEAKPCRYWGPQDYHCHSQAPRPQSLVGWGICQPQRPEMTVESLSVRKTSRTAAWCRSTPSTRKARATESLSVRRRFRTSAWRRSTSSTRKPKAQLSQT